MGVLDGKVTIITGGARGIGRAYALGVSAEGGRVVIADLLDGSPVVEELVASGGEAISVTTDVSDEASTAAMAEAAVERFGRVDVLINNAAMFSETTRGPFTGLSVDEWDRTFEVNVRGVWLVYQGRLSAYGRPGFRQDHQHRVEHLLQGNGRLPPLRGEQVGAPGPDTVPGQ